MLCIGMWGNVCRVVRSHHGLHVETKRGKGIEKEETSKNHREEETDADENRDRQRRVLSSAMSGQQVLVML